ncbi:hypothetical protein [Streptomyces avidinii]|uniref:Uncharacterized protein n=1 Tax=Streptomyces avidinii TaxID=1895 RepID=A0ABS4L705_STRAV|nr:hypothetical protein [Streptomyces avidinii]MBP2037911.1 hypothetical protein [Streptomyces avidinii]GGZ07758.1 hypothetical protein GCM10010343_37370 [Streptomyces avidinii]
MNEPEPRKPTPPSEAPGESGDRAARKEAEDALVPGTGDSANGPARRSRTEAERRSADRRGEDGKHGKHGKR